MSETEMITDPYGVSRPKNQRDRIRELARAIPRVDTQGVNLPVDQQSPTVQARAGYESPKPALGDVIVRIAGELRLDPMALLADDTFAEGILGHDPTDEAGIADAMRASNVRPAMKPNPAQGASGDSLPAPEPATGIDSVRHKTAQHFA